MKSYGCAWRNINLKLCILARGNMAGNMNHNKQKRKKKKKKNKVIKNTFKHIEDIL